MSHKVLWGSFSTATMFHGYCNNIHPISHFFNAISSLSIREILSQDHSPHPKWVSYLLIDSLHTDSTRGHFLSLALGKLRLCSANYRAGYWSNLPCDWPSTAWAYSEQETENGCSTFVLNQAWSFCWSAPAPVPPYPKTPVAMYYRFTSFDHTTRVCVDLLPSSASHRATKYHWKLRVAMMPTVSLVAPEVLKAVYQN